MLAGPAAAATEGASLEPVAPAIGRFNHAGYADRRHCTAFLVAPRTAVTAAHCLAGVDAGRTHVLLGYDRVAWREHIVPASGRAAADGRDLAVLCLSAPAAADPLPVAVAGPERGEAIRAVGYGQPAVHRLTTRACAVAAPLGEGRFLMDCGVSPGTSGGPVLRRTDEGAEVVGVVSESARASAVFVALRPDDVAGACGAGE